NLAKAFQLSGRIKEKQGQIKQAGIEFDRGIKQFNLLILIDPENPDYLKSRADLLQDIASSLQARGNTSAEQAAYLQALEAYERLVEVVPDNQVYTQTWAIALYNLGTVQFRTNNLAAANDSFSRSSIIYKDLFERSQTPDNKTGYAVNMQKLGECSLYTGYVSDARIYTEESVLLFKELVTEFTGQRTFLERLAIARRHLADIEVAEGQLETAEELLDTSLKELAQLIDLVEVDHAYRSNRASLLARKGEILTTLDRPDEALTCWQEARKEWEHVLTQEPFAEKQFLLARLIVHHPSLQNDETLARALELAGSCVKQVPANPRYQNLLAHAELLSGRLEDADRSLVAARQARQQKSGLDDLVASLIATQQNDQLAAEKHTAAARSWLSDVQPGNPRLHWLLDQFLRKSP
ncbi:MAG: hypothetical protein QGH11_05820, partial [Pirellulaceae bacterium]|nr:hypothetical protein [Pirellulaceae bacterium]